MTLALPSKARPCIASVVLPCSMTGIQFSVEHRLGDAVIGHPHKVSGPTKLRTLDVMFDAILCAAL